MRTFQEWVSLKYLDLLASKANLDISKFDSKELQMGFDVEKEHGGSSDTNVTGGDPVKTLKIAVAHLREEPNYYSKLKKVEEK